MPEAARITDPTSHGPPLNPGPGSKDVLIGYQPAWRAVPAGAAAAIDGISNAMKAFMDQPVLTPADAASKIADISQKLTKGGADAAAAGAPAAPAAAGSQLATLNTANVSLTTAWTSASAAPGGQPAANTAYTEGIKAAAAAAASAVMSAMASLSDMHVCPIPCPVPPHGPGFVTKGSSTVLINNLPAARKDDKVMEACGGADPIGMGCSTVLIDDQTGSGGGGSGGGGGSSSSAAAEGGGGGAGSEESPSEQTYSDTEPAQAPPGESTQSAGTYTHWIGLELVDEAELPIAGERYELVLSDGKETGGALDAYGKVRVTGLKDAGACQIRFPNLDLAAWERWRPGRSALAEPTSPGSGSAPGSAAGQAEDAPVPRGSTVSGGAWRTVVQGECISSIAMDTGHFWQTVWDAAANAELKRIRGNPNILRAGDAVFVPDKRQRSESGATDQHHKFVRRGEPSQLRLRVLDDDEPRANTPYTLEVDGREFSGVTDGDGQMTVPIPGNARRAKLRVGEPGNEEEYDLDLGTVDPINTATGVQQRLENLGFLKPGAGNSADALAAAVSSFQEKNRLPVTGEVDAATQNKLLQEHGS